MNLTAEQLGAIAAKVGSMKLPRGMGDKRNACSIAAINLALSGRLTDAVPDCMSAVIGDWIIKVQDAMPHKMRNSKTWKGLLPLAAGTGRDHEKGRLAMVVDWLWTVVLPYLQPVADANGYGQEWRAMYELRTAGAAMQAAKAAKAAKAFDAVAAADATWAVIAAGQSPRAADYAADGAAEVAEAAAKVVKKSGDPKKAWAHFDPCGLLQKLIEVGK
jgi:hypothetical protein